MGIPVCNGAAASNLYPLSLLVSGARQVYELFKAIRNKIDPTPIISRTMEKPIVPPGTLEEQSAALLAEAAEPDQLNSQTVSFTLVKRDLNQSLIENDEWEEVDSLDMYGLPIATV